MDALTPVSKGFTQKGSLLNPYRSEPVEKLYRKSTCREENERRWFAGLLWRAFPEAISQEELAELVADVLTTDKRPVHPKTVRNWLNLDHAPHFRYVIRVIAMAGAESLFDIIDAEAA